jgi:hypothetical protein
MLDLKDPRWAQLTGGYRRPYDARPLLAAIAKAPLSKESWAGVWDELHHQGDLGTASYAVVPHLVALFAQSPRCWEFYAYLALVALECRSHKNPPIPAWMEQDYSEAQRQAGQLALADLAQSSDPLLLRTALSVVAFSVGAVKLGALLSYLDESEVDELVEDRLDWSSNYGRVAG